MSNTDKKIVSSLCQRAFAAVKSDRGVRHETNEDAFSLIRAEGYKVFIVADGMGGPSKGEIASHLALSTIETFLKPKKHLSEDDLLTSILRANKALVDLTTAGPNFTGIGTTLSALAIVGDSILFAHVGNSRIYHLSGDNTTQLTTDHTLANEGIEGDDLTESEAQESDKMLTRFLGSEAELEVDLQHYTSEVKDGDFFLVCSDGLFDALSTEKIREVVYSQDLKTAARELVRLANEKSGRDNVTALLVRIGEEAKRKEGEEASKPSPSSTLEFPASLATTGTTPASPTPGISAASGMLGAAAGASVFGASSEFLGRQTTSPGSSKSSTDKATKERSSKATTEESAQDSRSGKAQKKEAATSPSKKAVSESEENADMDSSEDLDLSPESDSLDEGNGDPSQQKKKKRKRKRKRKKASEGEGSDTSDAGSAAAATVAATAAMAAVSKSESEDTAETKRESKKRSKQAEAQKADRERSNEQSEDRDPEASEAETETESEDHAGFDSPEEFDDFDDQEWEEDPPQSESEEGHDDSDEEYSYLRPPAYQQKRSTIMRRVLIAMFIGFGCGAVLALLSRGGEEMEVASTSDDKSQNMNYVRQRVSEQEASLEELLGASAGGTTQKEETADEKPVQRTQVAALNTSQKSDTKRKQQQLEMKHLVSADSSQLPPIADLPPPQSEGRIFSDDIIAKVEQISSPAMKMMAIEVYGAIRQTIKETDDQIIRMAERQVDTFTLLEQVSVEIEKLEREQESRTSSQHNETLDGFVEFPS